MQSGADLRNVKQAWLLVNKLHGLKKVSLLEIYSRLVICKTICKMDNIIVINGILLV